MAPIELTDLTATYGRLIGTDSLSVIVEGSEKGGYFGPTVARRDTIIRTLFGLLVATSGTVTVLATDARGENTLLEVKQRIGHLLIHHGFNEEMATEQVDGFRRYNAIKGTGETGQEVRSDV